MSPIKIIIIAALVLTVALIGYYYSRSKKKPVPPVANKALPQIAIDPGTGSKIVSNLSNGLNPDQIVGPDAPTSGLGDSNGDLNGYPSYNDPGLT